jgi:hypothetical protein
MTRYLPPFEKEYLFTSSLLSLPLIKFSIGLHIDRCDNSLHVMDIRYEQDWVEDLYDAIGSHITHLKLRG